MLTSVSPLPFYENNELIISGSIPPGSTLETNNAIVGSIYMEGDIKWIKTKDGIGTTKWAKESSVLVFRDSMQLWREVKTSYLLDGNLIYGSSLPNTVKELKDIYPPILQNYYIDSNVKTYEITTNNLFNGINIFNEGGTIEVTITTTGVSNGTLIKFSIVNDSRYSYDTNRNIFKISPSVGTVLIHNNIGKIVLTSTYDITTQYAWRYVNNIPRFLFMLDNGKGLPIYIKDTTPIYNYGFNVVGGRVTLYNYVYNDEEIIVTFYTINVPDGTVLTYEITGLTSEECVQPLTNTVVVISNTAETTLTFTKVFIPSNTKPISIELKVPEDHDILTITLTNAITHTLSSNTLVNTEGSSILIELRTTNVQDGFPGVDIPYRTTTYTITGVTQEDISIPLTGVLTIIGNCASIAIPINKDHFTEGTEILTLATPKASIDITILDTSTTRTFNTDSDPYLDNTILLIQSDGTSGTSGIVDYSPRGRKLYSSDTLLKSNQSESLMGTSLEFKNTSPVFVAVNNDLDFISGDFTIEARVYASEAYSGTFLSLGSSILGTQKLSFSLLDGAFVEYHLKSGSDIWLNSYDLNPRVLVDTWVTVAIVKYNGTITLYVNGKTASVSVDPIINMNTNYCLIGGDYYSGTLNRYQGFVDAVRISNIARYTSEYTPLDKTFPFKRTAKSSSIISDIISKVSTATATRTSARLQLGSTDYGTTGSIVGIEVGPNPSGGYTTIVVNILSELNATDIFELFRLEFNKFQDLLDQGWSLTPYTSYSTLTSPLGLSNCIIRGLYSPEGTTRMDVRILDVGVPTPAPQVIDFRIGKYPYNYSLGDTITITLNSESYSCIVDTLDNVEIATKVADIISAGGLFSACYIGTKDYYEGGLKYSSECVRVASLVPSNIFSYSGTIIYVVP